MPEPPAPFLRSVTPPAGSPAAPVTGPRNATEVFAVHGADPEVLAYAMAKYSRSSLSMKQSLQEIGAQRAEQFLNTFYFQYGHRSIADLAHVAFAIERLSLLAAIVLVDEQRWDGQERSTRYQDFEKSGWYLPLFAPEEAEAERAFTGTVEGLFAAYRAVSDGVLASLTAAVQRPEAMKPEAYTRTLRARAFDVARYLLPLATNTSLGQIVNARTLETQVSRLLSHPLAEVRELGEQLRRAAAGTAWNPHAEALGALAAEIRAADPALGDRAHALLTREVRVAPTLVKYAAPNPYAVSTAALLRQAAGELLDRQPIAPAPLVDLVDGPDPLEVELATSLLYTACHYPYRQIRDQVRALPAARRDEIIDLGLRERGRHDELLREFSAGQGLRFDILMDIGGFRDMHRHRRCVQLIQDFTPLHGYETSEGLEEAGLTAMYSAAMDAAHAAAAGLSPSGDARSQYLLPLGTRVRALFKMDFAEALYIAELRSGPQGHFSYRRVAWEMYQAVARQHPSLARYFRVTDIREPVDLLRR
ncbi:MAG TPA: FAD-dependent thymidylate synthase [Acidobacteriaceae bacterium]